MNALNIGNRIVGPGNPVLVIAEIGVNHDGSLRRALELVELAHRAGADAVKLQIFQADALVNPAAGFAAYQQDRVDDAHPSQMLRRYELPALDLVRIIGAITDAGMVPLATPFSTADVEAIAALTLPAIKIASPDVVNYSLLSAAAKLNLPMLISTGASTMEELVRTVDWMEDWDVDFALLHCVSSYPVPQAEAHLSWINQLAEAFDVPVGYSDHTTQTWSGALAVAAGAHLVERHLTYDREAVGPDHAASSNPSEFTEYVRLIRQAENMCGHAGKHVLSIEQDVRLQSRQSLVAARDLPAGHVIRETDLIVQRPGTGISAAEFAHTVGKKTSIAIAAGTVLQPSMFAGCLSNAA